MKNSKLTGAIHHIEIYVSDLKKSVKFWSWLLEKFNYKVYQDWYCGKSWILNNTYIVLVQTEKKHQNIKYHRSRTGLNHIAFFVDTRNQVDKLTIELKSKGYNILYKNRHPYAGGENHYAVYFEDPDRIKIEVVSAE